MASPRLTASVLAMLETRVKLLENKRERGRVEGKLRSFVQKCKSHTWEVFKEKSFGTEPSPVTPIERRPCQCPWDMEVWEAKPWPEDLKGLVPEDVVLVSRDGHGTPAWLGGTMTAI